MAALRALVAASSLAAAVRADLGLVARRPNASSWRRTQCGSPTSSAEIPSRWAADVSASRQPLPLYPRPQMVRGAFSDERVAGAGPALRDGGDPETWANLNGLWEWERATSAAPRFGQALAGSILVPFPVESCLSGQAPQTSADVVKEMWYRLPFDVQGGSGRTLLHFGAVDWQTTVYLNGQWLGNHTGGYDGFSFDVTEHLQASDNELLLYVFDPSDDGAQPEGKQVTWAISEPHGHQYTPNSGIWQTVWMERVPETYIEKLKIKQASTSAVSVCVRVAEGGRLGETARVPVRVTVLDPVFGKIAHADGRSGEPGCISIQIPLPALWSPDSPALYDLQVSTDEDAVLGYFGLRTFTLGKVAGVVHPMLNDEYIFMVGVLDQSWWPDGQYTAPTDEALASDINMTKTFGMNLIRLHQKVNPERWYYHADRLGVAVFQDAVQKNDGATHETIPYFVEDMKSMIAGRANHPCILQWEIFNEFDCWWAFEGTPYDPDVVLAAAQDLDRTRLIDMDSGPPFWSEGDVTDLHIYPSPWIMPYPSAKHYAMVGEYGGAGLALKGREWVPGGCDSYLNFSSSAALAEAYIDWAGSFERDVGNVSVAVYTQLTDVELECDGLLNYDRSNKFSAAETLVIREANQAIIRAGRNLQLAEQFTLSLLYSPLR